MLLVVAADASDDDESPSAPAHDRLPSAAASPCADTARVPTGGGRAGRGATLRLRRDVARGAALRSGRDVLVSKQWMRERAELSSRALRFAWLALLPVSGWQQATSLRRRRASIRPRTACGSKGQAAGSATTLASRPRSTQRPRAWNMPTTAAQSKPGTPAAELVRRSTAAPSLLGALSLLSTACARPRSSAAAAGGCGATVDARGVELRGAGGGLGLSSRVTSR
jgi:hypothetical protein